MKQRRRIEITTFHRRTTITLRERLERVPIEPLSLIKAESEVTLTNPPDAEAVDLNRSQIPGNTFKQRRDDDEHQN